MIPKPWSVQLEVTEGCNYRCWFCGIHAIRGKEYEWNHMDPEKIVRPAFKQLHEWCGKIRVELNNHGEPTLNPGFFDILKIIKEECPRAQIQLQTNGHSAFPQVDESNDFIDFVDKFFECGGNLLMLNCYKKGHYEYAMQQSQLMLDDEPTKFRLVDFYYNNPENYSAYRYYSPKSKMVFVCQDLGMVNVDGTSKKRLAKEIINEAGNSPEKSLKGKLDIDPVTEPLKKGCSRVFRELTIGWNGIIPSCCYDWSNDLVFGKFPEQGLREIWEGQYWQAARVLLYPKTAERKMAPCDRCDYKGGFRLGLIKPPESDLSVEEAYDTLLGAEVDFSHHRHPNSQRRIDDKLVQITKNNSS